MKIIGLLLIGTITSALPVTDPISNSANPLIDLSYAYNELTPTFPSQMRFHISKTVNKGPSGDLKWLYVNNICTSEHSGTHMDAPAHFYEHGKTIDLISYKKLYRVPGIKVDLIEKASQDPQYIAQSSDLDEWVMKNGELPDGVVVLFEFGREKLAHDEDMYLGRDENGTFHWPGIGKSAADWIVNYGRDHGQLRGVLGVGLDSVSLDASNSERPAHLTLLGNEVFGIENMKNLDKLPARNFTLTMLPIKIGGGSGGPSRVLAELYGTPYMQF